MPKEKTTPVTVKYIGDADMQALLDKYLETDFEMPEELSPEGRKAWYQIMKYIESEVPQGEELYMDGGKAFYSPKAWKDRKEDYGTEGILVVVYDGGDLPHFFNMDYGQYKLLDGLQEALSDSYAEACTCWYSAIYKDV